MLEPSFALLVAALALDYAFGEYPNALHPVAWMGRLAGALSRRVLGRGPQVELAAGVGIVIVVAGAAVAASMLLLIALPPGLTAFVLGAMVLKSTFALRALGEAAARVREPLAAGDIDGARAALRGLCSRDAAALDADEVAAATVESVAENLSDSFVAPLLWYAVLGLPGAIAYRAINTLDAMIGYHGRFEHLGKAAARLDDLMNWIPARVTALLLIAGGALSSANTRLGWHVWRRDARATESPNAGHPMAAMAGLLGVRLEKRDAYALGDPLVPVRPATIGAAWRIATAGAGLAVLLVDIILGVRGVL